MPFYRWSRGNVVMLCWKARGPKRYASDMPRSAPSFLTAAFGTDHHKLAEEAWATALSR